ncbi:hypothetical protein SUNI508_03586 [Seiridium unicorne]|uniref:SprT-like domain-containing protein n=1 Tax=Seiridium unicorne TaxID=138068 RepID=A0ABR2VB19_9PEZI
MNIEPLAHDPDELVSLVVANIASSQGPHQFRKRLKQDFIDLCDRRSQYPVAVFVQRAFIILDWYFFLHALSGHKVRPSVEHHCPYSGFMAAMVGTYMHDKRIVVYTHFSCGKRARTHDQVMCTLVHEMAHAYLSIFSSPSQYQQKVGVNFDHGVPWNALHHTIVNTISQWCPGFGEITDKHGGSYYVSISERLEYPLAEASSPDEEEDKGSVLDVIVDREQEHRLPIASSVSTRKSADWLTWMSRSFQVPFMP